MTRRSRRNCIPAALAFAERKVSGLYRDDERFFCGMMVVFWRPRVHGFDEATDRWVTILRPSCDDGTPTGGVVTMPSRVPSYVLYSMPQFSDYDL